VTLTKDDWADHDAQLVKYVRCDEASGEVGATDDEHFSPGADLISSIRSIELPAMTVVLNHSACSTVFEKTSLGLVFIRVAMASSLARA
jgi:hypothetical protein